MATIQQFEDFEAWQEARVLVQQVYALSRRGDFAKDFALCDQIRRAGISVMSNIAEGFERGGTREFIQFLATARASAGEVKAQLYVALDQQYITRAAFETTYGQASTTVRLITGLMKYLGRSTLKGTKFKGR